MIIERTTQPEFQMKFSRDEGITLIAALKEFARNHNEAVNKERWIKAAEQIEKVIYNI